MSNLIGPLLCNIRMGVIKRLILVKDTHSTARNNDVLCISFQHFHGLLKLLALRMSL